MQLRDNNVRFVAEGGLPDEMHVQHYVVHDMQGHVGVPSVVDVVVAFRRAVANHGGTVLGDLFLRVNDVVVEQILRIDVRLKERKRQQENRQVRAMCTHVQSVR